MEIEDAKVIEPRKEVIEAYPILPALREDIISFLGKTKVGDDDSEKAFQIITVLKNTQTIQVTITYEEQPNAVVEDGGAK